VFAKTIDVDVSVSGWTEIWDDGIGEERAIMLWSVGKCNNEDAIELGAYNVQRRRGCTQYPNDDRRQNLVASEKSQSDYMHRDSRRSAPEVVGHNVVLMR